MYPTKYYRAWESFNIRAYCVYFTFKGGQQYPLYETPGYAASHGFLHPYAEHTSVTE